MISIAEKGRSSFFWYCDIHFLCQQFLGGGQEGLQGLLILEGQRGQPLNSGDARHTTRDTRCMFNSSITHMFFSWRGPVAVTSCWPVSWDDHKQQPYHVASAARPPCNPPIDSPSALSLRPNAKLSPPIWRRSTEPVFLSRRTSPAIHKPQNLTSICNFFRAHNLY